VGAGSACGEGGVVNEVLTLKAIKALPVWFFVAYGGGHVKALLPVAQRVLALGEARPVFLALTTAAPLARAVPGLEVLGFQDILALYSPEERQCALLYGERLARDLAVAAADPAETIAYLGLSYADLENQTGTDEAAQRYAQYGRQCFLPLGPLTRLLQKWRPTLVVTTNAPRAERAALQAARNLAIPSVCLVDLLAILERPLLAQASYADALCVLNEGVRGSLITAGRVPATVHTTGNPAFDGLCSDANRALGVSYRQQAGWGSGCGSGSENLHVLLYASSPEPSEYPDVHGVGDPQFPRHVERALIDAVLANPRLALWIRRHPSEPACVIGQGGVPQHPRIQVSAPEMALHGCLHGCDEVVVTMSTVGVEGHLAGKPVTQVAGSILSHFSPFETLGFAQRTLALVDLAHAYASSYFQLLLLPVPAHTAGQAADRVLDVLRNTVGQP